MISLVDYVKKEHNKEYYDLSEIEKTVYLSDYNNYVMDKVCDPRQSNWDEDLYEELYADSCEGRFNAQLSKWTDTFVYGDTVNRIYT